MTTEIFNNQSVEVIEKRGDEMKIIEGLRRRKCVTEEPNYDRFKESMEFSIKHDKIKDRVKSILMFDKFARKNDLWLYLIYLVKMGYIDMKIDIKQFNKVNPPESISRARRLLYSEIKQGKHPELKYLIDSDTEKTRNNEEMLYEDYVHQKNAGNIAEKIK